MVVFSDDEDNGVPGELRRSSFHLDSKYLRNTTPLLPTSESSSLKVLQFANISLVSAENSALFLYLEIGKQLTLSGIEA